MTTTTISEAIVWPEDAGTGAPVESDSGDWASAGHMGTAITSIGLGGYVGTGMGIGYNPSDTTMDIGQGLAFVEFNGTISVQSTSSAYDTSWAPPMVFLVSVPAVSNLALDASSVNDVYLAVDPTAGNGARYVYGSSVSAPTDPHIKLGTVDTSDGTTTHTNKNPEMKFESLTSTGGATFGDNIDISDNNVSNVAYQSFNVSSNDFFQLNDGSGGSNSSPYTFRFDDRGLRFWAGGTDDVGQVATFGTDGSLTLSSGGVDAQSITTPELAGALTGGTAITDITGSNLSIDTNGVLNASDTDTDTRTNISDDGTQIVADASDVNFAANLSVTDDTDGSVTVDSADTNTQNTTTALYMSDYTTPGDGTADDSAFDSAISDASAGDTIVFDHGNYLITSSHTISKSLTIRGVNGDIEYTNTANNNAGIHFQGGGVTADTTTTAAVSVGDRTIPVTDASLFSPGDRVLLMSAQYGVNTDAKIHFGAIESVDTTNGDVSIEGSLSIGFDSGVYLHRVDLLDSPRIVDIDTHGGGTRHLQFSWCEDPLYDSVSVSEYLEVSLYAFNCWKPRYRDVQATDPTGLASGEGEPITVARSTDAYIESPRVYDCRRGIDLAWGARNVAIVDPVIRGVSLVGISVHQDQQSGVVMISGGEIVCDPNGQSGHCIAMSSSAVLYISDTRLVARENGLICHSETHADGLTIEPVTAAGGYGINIKSGDVTIDDCYIDDPDDVFEYCIWLDGSAPDVQSVDIDAETASVGENHIYFDCVDTGSSIEHVTIRGNYRNLNSGQQQTVMLDARNDGVIKNVDIAGNFRGVPTQAIRIYRDGTNATVGDINVHDSYFNTGKAAIYTDGADGFGSISVTDCTCDTGGTSLSFNETVDHLHIAGNDVTGSIDTSGASVVDGFLSSGTASLAGGSTTIATGVTQPLDVYLDPSNGGSAASDVDVVASVKYDSSAGENVVEIAEDSTAVGDPTIAYQITGKP